MRDARVERTPCFIRVRNATNSEERLCDSESRVPWSMQCPPGKRRDKRAGRVGKHLRGGTVTCHSMIVSILEFSLAWLAGSCGTGAEEVESYEDYAGRA